MKVRKNWRQYLAAILSVVLTMSLLITNTQLVLAGSGTETDAYGPGIRTLTVQYSDIEGNTLFKSQAVTVQEQPGGFVTDLTAYNPYFADWQVAVYRDSSGSKITDPTRYNMKGKNRTVTLVLEPQENMTLLGETTFYDYTVAPYTGNKYNPYLGEYVTHPERSINTAANYKDTDSVSRLSAGTGKNQDWPQNYEQNQYTAWINGLDANVFQGNEITRGIVTGLSADYSEVLFRVDEPGFFSSQPKIGKTIINDYKLQFEKKGYTYRLSAVLDENGNETAKSGSDFWPLDNTLTDWTHDNKDGNFSPHNYYFGMRYDISFTLGDYQGPLTYSFSGDDDVWVLLDGKVVLDIGGIHNTISQSVNLWDCETIQNSSPDTVHHLTVLYMERGANASNCTMRFVIPNAVFEEVPTAAVSFYKTDDTQGYALAGARFKLVSDSNESACYEAVSGTDGLVTFEGLTAGTYTLTEETAPDGYQLSEKIWKVVVSANGKYTVSAALFEADGITPVENGRITNERDGTNTQPSIGNVTQKKTAQLVDWEERTYKIDLYAAHHLEVSEPVNIVMALDISGSMAWFVTEPTGGTTRLRNLTAADRQEQTLERGGSTGPSAWNYTYYVLRQSEGGAYEYKPIGYDSSDRTWKVIKSKSSGEKIFEKDDDVAVSSYERIYIRGGNDQTKYEALIASVQNFINNLKTVSPASRVGFILFAGENKKTAALTKVHDIELNTLFNVPLYGNTNQEVALMGAQKLFEGIAGDKNNIVLFSDGAPNAKGISLETIGQAASQIKDKNITLYTAGIFKDSSNDGYKGLVSWASEGCAFLADTAAALMNAFNAVFANINVSISGVTVRDYIDSRFILTDSAGNPLYAGDSVDGGVVGYDAEKGLYYVEWMNQTLGYAQSPVSGWHQTLFVRAKEDFIGGNNVTTNAPGSGITLKDGTKSFDRPEVNVRTVLKIQDISEVLFYGDTAADTGTVIGQMMASGNYSMGEDGMAVRPEDFLARWYLNETCTDLIASDELENNNAGYMDGLYYGTFQYRVSDPTQESLENSGGRYADGTAVNQTDSGRRNAQYRIRFVKGEIDLIKVIDEQYTGISGLYANQTFIFKIEQFAVEKDSDGNEKKGDLTAVFYATIAFDANGNVTSGNRKICGLKKGYYTVTEESGWSLPYQLTQMSDNDTENSSEGTDLFVGRRLGGALFNEIPEFYGLETYETPSKGALYLDAAKGTEAVVTFTGRKDKAWKWLSDAASAINQFIRLSDD